jgi:hypothetical protein
MLRASTPGCFALRPEAPRSASFDQELPPPGSFRPCRSSRLRRLSPLEHRRLVASCSRPWGSPRFRPVPPSIGCPGGGTRRCSVPVLPKWSAAITCLRGLRSEDLFPRRSVMARSSPWRAYPSKVFPRSRPSLVARSLLLRRLPWGMSCLASTLLQPVPSRRSVRRLPPDRPVVAGFPRRSFPLRRSIRFLSSPSASRC